MATALGRSAVSGAVTTGIWVGAIAGTDLSPSRCGTTPANHATAQTATPHSTPISPPPSQPRDGLSPVSPRRVLGKLEAGCLDDPATPVKPGTVEIPPPLPTRSTAPLSSPIDPERPDFALR